MFRHQVLLVKNGRLLEDRWFWTHRGAERFMRIHAHEYDVGWTACCWWMTEWYVMEDHK